MWRSALNLAAALLLLPGCARPRDPAPAPTSATVASAASPPVELSAADVAQLPPPLRPSPSAVADEALRPPEIVHFSSAGYALIGFVYRPNVAGRLPAVIYNHGSEPDPTLEALGRPARWWQARGFVAFVPFRRGSRGPEGSSEGPYWQAAVDAAAPDERDRALVRELELHSDDVLAAIAFLQHEDYVDRRLIAVSGCSFGGIETALTAERSKGVYAALDLAGASFMWSRSPALRERLTTAVRASQVPIFFLQAENDYDTEPSRKLAGVMDSAGKPRALKIYPPYGGTVEDGHGGFCNRGMPIWGDDALAFLRHAALGALASR